MQFYAWLSCHSMQWHVCSIACRDHHLPKGGCDLQFIFSFVTMSREHRMVLTLTCCLSNMLHCTMIRWARIVKLSNDIMTQLTRLPQHYCNIRGCPEKWSMHDMACMFFLLFHVFNSVFFILIFLLARFSACFSVSLFSSECRKVVVFFHPSVLSHPSVSSFCLSDRGICW